MLEIVTAIASGTTVAASASIVANFIYGFLKDRVLSRYEAAEQAELSVLQAQIADEIEQAKGSTAASSDSAGASQDAARLSALEAKLADTRVELAELQATVPFAREARRAKWASTIAFGSGILVVAAVVGIGLQEWLSSETPVEISTGTGLARIGVIAGAFYLAGQLFRRSTTLHGRSQELERASIAMRTVRTVALHLSSVEQQDELIRSVYQQHLTGIVASKPATKPDASETLDVVKLFDTANKLRP